MNTSQDLGRLLLRLTVGVLLAFYGYHKITNGVDWMDGMLEAKGLPVFMKYGVYVGEVLAPVLLIVGFMTRIAGLTVAGTMGFAIFLAHVGEIGSLNAHGGWAIDDPLMFLLGGLTIALLGAGRFSIDGRCKPTN